MLKVLKVNNESVARRPADEISDPGANLKPWRGWCNFLWKYVRTKRAKRTKCPRIGFRRGGSVRLKRLMRHKLHIST
jgi:hypothetical protein